MPWKETCPMDERLRFVAAMKSGTSSVSGFLEMGEILNECFN